MPRKKKQTSGDEQREPKAMEANGEYWYTAGDAAIILTRNSHREVKPDYVSKLGWLDTVRTLKVNPRVTFYYKADIDGYIVEDRGTKSAAAKKAKAAQGKEKKP